MSASDIQLDNGPAGAESLALVFQGIVRHGGLDVDFDTVNALLGLSCLATAPDEGFDLGGAAFAGRDWNLLDAAQVLGMELRPLHPPPAAIGVDRAEAFELHFVDSYVPLIRQALEHGQPVLAWGGWDASEADQWGVVTAVTDSGIGLAGRTPASEGARTTITTASRQCYVVESPASADLPDGPEVFRFSVAAAERCAHNRLDPALHLTTGWQAFEVWENWLRNEASSNSAFDAMVLSRVAQTAAVSRQSWLDFLARHRARHGESLEPAVDELSAVTREVIAALGPLRMASAVEPMLRDKSGRATLADDVAATRKAEHDLAGALNRLLRLLEASRED